MKITHKVLASATALLLLCPTLPANAHFIWMQSESKGGDGCEVRLHFGESADDGDADLLHLIEKAEVVRVSAKGATEPITLTKKEEAIVGHDSSGNANSIYLASHNYGVLARGGEPFWLKYYAKAGPELGHDAWKTKTAKKIVLDATPRVTKQGIRLRVLFHGKPIAGAEVVAAIPGHDGVEVNTDEKGTVNIPRGDAGLYSIRIRHVEEKSGDLKGEKYASIKHYTTLSLQVGSAKKEKAPPKLTAAKTDYPEIPETVTSFGAAVAGDRLYYYGGHMGGAHSYSKDGQAHTLWQLDLQSGGKWQKLADGPHLQGLAMVAHSDKLYRMGGFTAKNAEGEEHDLWSQETVAVFDLKAKNWKEIAPLPEPRSSFDAAVLENEIYVVGGWKLAGKDESTWHMTAHVLDLSSSKLLWQALPTPPFQRRALSAAAFNGKLYAIGGMQQKGGPTTRVDIYDPKTKKWTLGPKLNGKGMDGFGSSSFATGGRLYVSTYSGLLQRLSEDGSKWEVVGALPTDRFFHRMLPRTSDSLVFLGGASMSSGKFSEIEVIEVGAHE